MNEADRRGSDGPSSAAPLPSRALKRPAADGQLQSDHAPPPAPPPKAVKRRAPQACQSCRVRKVRCDVAKHGTPCIHCRLDEIECVVGESKRKKKRKSVDETSIGSQSGGHFPSGEAMPAKSGMYNGSQYQRDHAHGLEQGSLASQSAMAPPSIPYHVQAAGQATGEFTDATNLSNNLSATPMTPFPILPAYIKPLPTRFGPDDITYLRNKGALTIPHDELRNELLRSYGEHFHPLMPLIDWHELVRSVDRNDGLHPVSLLLFQAVMFTGVATVPTDLLRAAGYNTRREARRDFYSRTRLLYDLDYENDSTALIQALLLMSYWREDPDGRKETHHWIEVAVSLARKIGLHRATEDSTVSDARRQRLRKRIWWSAYVRDTWIALGTQTTTRIKEIDFDVPMLQLTDFELEALPLGQCCIPAECQVARDTEKQRQLAVMCIEMANLCLCTSHILSVQHDAIHFKGSAQTAMMLLVDPQHTAENQIEASMKILHAWQNKLPDAAQFITPSQQDLDMGNSCLVLNRTFLHMVYYAALSALHRPQIQASTVKPSNIVRSSDIDASRKAVRLAATRITTLAATLHNLGLVRYLPSPTITVLLPAIVVHLLDVLAPSPVLQRKSLQDFCICMQIMAALRDMYAAADYATAFLQAAIQGTDIGPERPTDDDQPHNSEANAQRQTAGGLRGNAAGRGSDASQRAASLAEPAININDQRSHDHFDFGRQVDYLSPSSHSFVLDGMGPPDDPSPRNMMATAGASMNDHINDFDMNFGTGENAGAAGMFNGEDGAFGNLQGGDGGIPLDTSWLMGLGSQGLMLTGEQGSSGMF